MQKHPLLSVKEAAEMLRLDERSVRERLINGQLKGEKKQIGLRDKWFVYSGSVEAAVSKQGVFSADPTEFADVTVESETTGQAPTSNQDEQIIDDAATGEWMDINRGKLKVLAEEIVKPLMEKIELQQEVIFSQKQTIADQDRQLKLLPDLQRQSEQHRQEVDLKHVESEALKKQIAAMSEEKALLEAQIAASKRSWWQKVLPGR